MVKKNKNIIVPTEDLMGIKAKNSNFIKKAEIPVKSNPEISEYDVKINSGTVKEIKKHQGLKLSDRFKLWKNPSKSFIVEMIFSNNTCREFVIVSDEETFEYNKRTYYLRYQDSKFNLSHKEWKLVFHEDYATPITQKIIQMIDEDADDLHKKAFFSVRPHTLKPLLKMEYIRALTDLDLAKYLKLALIFSIVSALGVIILIIINAKIIT